MSLKIIRKKWKCLCYASTLLHRLYKECRNIFLSLEIPVMSEKI